MFVRTGIKITKILFLALISFVLIGCGDKRPGLPGGESSEETGTLIPILESMSEKTQSLVDASETDPDSTTVLENESNQEKEIHRDSGFDAGEIQPYAESTSLASNLPRKSEFSLGVVEADEPLDSSKTDTELSIPGMEDISLDSGEFDEGNAVPNFLEVASNTSGGDSTSVLPRTVSTPLVELKPSFQKTSRLSPAPAVPGTTLAREKLRTFQLLRQYESFSSDAYWDVNAWRVGYGQDTILGNSVYRGMRVSRSTAERAMVSRWSRWERPALIQQIGTGTFASLNADQRAVLMSLKWNYGKVPSRVVRAVNRGSCEGVADSIHTLRWHDRGINAWRRGSESKIYLQSCGSAYHRA